MNRVATAFSFHPLQISRMVLFSAILMTAVLVSSSQGMTDLYQLAQKSGTATNMSGSTQIYGPNSYYFSASTTYPIGFTFKFDKQDYTTFSVSPSGLMSLGKVTYSNPYSYYWPNYPDLSSYYPLLTASWCYYGGPSSSGQVHYKLTGTAPNRVLTVEWNNIFTVNSTGYTGGTWQIRLYEKSNKIEFYYGPFTINYTYYYFSVGIASSTTRYINVWGNDVTNQYYTYSSGQYYTYRYPEYYPISQGTIFEFSSCDKTLTGLAGNTAQGGTAGMKSGDVLLSGKQVQRGNTTGFQPFSFTLPANPCADWTYSISFAGAAAGDYSVPSNGSIITPNLAPVINFTPQGVGERVATMTVKVSDGSQFTYTLKGEGTSRMLKTGNIAQGGTSTMKDGDTLMSTMTVPRGSTGDFRPFNIKNSNLTPTGKGLTNATVSFTLDDPNNEYAIRLENSATSEKGSSVQGVTTLSTSLIPGATVTPVITFSPNDKGTERGTGPQIATLKVVADGEQITYILKGFSVAPALEFYFDNTRLIGSSGRLFINTISCVGENASSGGFVIENVNKVPVVINSMDVLLTESVVRQGTPPHPQQLDAYGKVIPMTDYFISTTVPTAPYSANSIVKFPLTIQPGERKNYYLAFIATRPDKRYARLFIHTNAVNFIGTDVPGYLPNASQNIKPQDGVMVLEAYAQGVGGHMAKNAEGQLGGLSLLFNPVKVGKSTTSETWIFNTGECDMRISKGDIRLAAGDVNDFELLEILPNTTVDSRGDFVIPPGGSDKITARFIPSRSGSRRASVTLKSNDSTLSISGVSDRGSYILDLYGTGQAYLEARSLQLPPAVINGSTSRGAVTVVNASTEPVMLTGATMSGPSIAEITADPAKPWPAFPIIVKPGEKMSFPVVLTPAATGTPGIRSISVEFGVRDGDPVTAQVTGLVGTRTIVANPVSMFRTAMVPVGGLKREYAVLTNAGTFPIHIDRVSVIGANATNYKISVLGRLDIDPGESQFIEVTYTPTAAGASTAQLEISSNATNGVQHIDLGGTGTSTSLQGGAPSTGTSLNNGGGAARTVAVAVAAVVPNPTRDKVMVSYTLASDGNAEIALYDLSGRMVRTLSNEYATAGEYNVAADLSDLTSGTYYITIHQGGTVAREAVVVTH